MQSFTALKQIFWFQIRISYNFLPTSIPKLLNNYIKERYVSRNPNLALAYDVIEVENKMEI